MYHFRKLNKKHPRVHKKRIEESTKVKGIYKFFSKPTGGNFKQIDEKKNLIMDDALNRMAQSFINTCTGYYYKIEYAAIGTDNTTPTASDTTLGTEVFRTPYVIRTNSSNGVVTVDFYITDSEYVGQIEEVGIFGGVFATGTADSGNLLSHVLWSYNKSGSEEILIEYEITVST